MMLWLQRRKLETRPVILTAYLGRKPHFLSLPVEWIALERLNRPRLQSALLRAAEIESVIGTGLGDNDVLSVSPCQLLLGGTSACVLSSCTQELSIVAYSPMTVVSPYIRTAFPLGRELQACM